MEKCAQAHFLSRLLLEIGHYVREPFVSGSSSFTVQVLLEELPQTEFEAGKIFWEPSTTNNC